MKICPSKIIIIIIMIIVYFFSQTYVDYGTILFISSLEYTPDGRSLVTTVGERRFQVFFIIGSETTSPYILALKILILGLRVRKKNGDWTKRRGRRRNYLI